MGCTHNRSAVIPPVEEQYLEMDGELFGCHVDKDKHCIAQRG